MAKTKFSQFLMPESEISVKIIFDNIRNYFYCAAIIAAGLWLLSGTPNNSSLANNARFQAFSPALAFVLLAEALCLAIINILQTFHLCTEVAASAFDRLQASAEASRNRSKARVYAYRFALLIALAIFGLLLIALALSFALLVQFAVTRGD